MVHKTRVRPKQKQSDSGASPGIGQEDSLNNTQQKDNIMSYSSVLKPREKIMFDPNNNDHVKDYASFLKSSNWVNGCKYILEHPFQDIPSMINHKLVRHFLARHM